MFWTRKTKLPDVTIGSVYRRMRHFNAEERAEVVSINVDDAKAAVKGLLSGQRL